MFFARYLFLIIALLCFAVQPSYASKETKANKLYNQVLILKRQGLDEKALELCREIVEKYPGQSVSIKANETIDTLIQEINKKKALDLIKEAGSLERKGNYLEELKVFRKVIEKYPKTPLVADVKLNIQRLEKKIPGILHKEIYKMLELGIPGNNSKIISKCKMLTTEFPNQKEAKDAQKLLPYLEDERFELRSGGTVFDRKLNLLWVRKGSKNPSTTAYNWHDESKLCENLESAGYSDWRMPTIEELKSLLIPQRVRNASGRMLYLNPLFINDTKWRGDSYWSSTQRDNDRGGHWFLTDFNTEKVKAARSNDIFPLAKVFPVRDADSAGMYQGRSTEEWLKDLRSNDPALQIAAIDALGRIYPFPVNSVPDLLAAMAAELRQAAQTATSLNELKAPLVQKGFDFLSETGEPGYSLTQSVIGDASDIETRLIGSYVLHGLANRLQLPISPGKIEELTGILLDALDDSRWLIRFLGAEVILEAMNVDLQNKMLPHLREFLSKEKHPDVLERFKSAVQRLEKEKS